MTGAAEGGVFGARPRLGVFLAAALAASMFCLGYPFMAALRATWQSHYPELAARWSNDGRWTLLGWYGTEMCQEELAYAARAADASRRVFAVDPYLKGRAGWRATLNDGLTYFVLGRLRRLTGDMNAAWLLARWLSCLAWFLLVFLIARRCGVPEPAALFAAVFVMAFSYVLTLLFVSALSWSGPPLSALAKNVWVLLSFGRTEGVLRTPRPALTYAFSFAAALAAVVAAERRRPGATAGAALLGALLPYVRLDVWTTHVLAAGAFALARGLLSRRLPWHEAAVALAAGLGGVPLVLANSPTDLDLLRRTGILFVREFDLWSLPYLAVFAHAAWRARTPMQLFLGCLSLGTFLMANLELVTGFRLLPEHWKYFGNIYVFLYLFALLPHRWTAPKAPWLAAAALAAAVACLQGLAYAAIHFPFQGLPRGYDQALRWLDANAPAESVVLALNPEVVGLLPVFTKSKTALAFAMPTASDVPTAENAARLAGALEFLGADRERFTKECVFNDAVGDRRALVAGGLARGTLERGSVKFLVFFFTPMETVKELWAAARPTPPEPDFVWVGAFEKGYLPKGFSRPGWTPAYESDSVTIYRAPAR